VDERFQVLAELAVHAANVQKGQVVAVGATVGQEELSRATAEAAYRRGALFVDVLYFDPYVKRARIKHAEEETPEFVPAWYAQRLNALAERGDARISFTGVVAPMALDGLDPERLGRDQLPSLKEASKVMNDRATNWAVVPCPHREWAKLVFPELDEEAAYDRLWDELWHVLRLDEDDPASAWESRIATLEEVFTTPDPLRTEGHVTSTKPLVLKDGAMVRGLRMRFEGGRAVEVEADENGPALRAKTEVDEGAARLGEVALVDRQGRIGPLGTVFYDTLLDENAASHIALGYGFEFAVTGEDAGRVNTSGIHIDFMIGSPELEVTGVRSGGDRIPVLRDGDWQV
jgi:aminopeptidase